MLHFLTTVMLVIIASGWWTGCSTVYYTFWEKLGQEKRDLLQDNVEAAQSDQERVAETFKDALTHLRASYKVEGGEVEKAYDTIRADYEAAKNRAEALEERIDKVKEIGEDLFEEWDDEIRSMRDETLKEKSRRRLEKTEKQFKTMRLAMERSEKSIGPVLAQLRDHTLYLKDNLNAKALGALKTETKDIEKNIEHLHESMIRSIKEASAFAKTLKD